MTAPRFCRRILAGFILAASCGSWCVAAEPARPNVILCMADDQGWGDVAYNGNEKLKTPTLDEMAATGLRFDRFYAAAPVCSPTRGSVLTGRHPNRFGCFSWGYELRPEEITLAELLQTAGYATGHFGKWHLGGVQADNPTSPGRNGFQTWFSSPNFFENSPLMSANGKIVKTEGEGSQVTVDAALKFIRAASREKQPFLAVVWFGSPHLPHVALDKDREPYAGESAALQNYWGEITAMDRAIGNLRKELRQLNIADNTLLWYTSDNGATTPGSTGPFKGKKGTLWEGGLRVPTIIEWPAHIDRPRTTDLPCCSVDILPTILDIASVQPKSKLLLDGVSLLPLLRGEMTSRAKPLGFWVYPIAGRGVRSTEILQAMSQGKPAPPPPNAKKKAAAAPPPLAELPGPAAWIDGTWKLHRLAGNSGEAKYSLYDLATDPYEKTDVANAHAERVARMTAELAAWQKSVVHSFAGDDYPKP